MSFWAWRLITIFLVGIFINIEEGLAIFFSIIRKLTTGVMRVMFSTIQSKEYHEALKSALRNADKRVGKKHPQADDAEISPKAKKRSKKRSRPPGFYENPFVKGSSQNTEEFENHEDDNL